MCSAAQWTSPFGFTKAPHALPIKLDFPISYPDLRFACLLSFHVSFDVTVIRPFAQVGNLGLIKLAPSSWSE